MHTNFGGAPQIFQQAIFFHDHGRLREAEQLYQKLLLGDDRHFGSLCRLGVLRLQQRRFEDAERLFRRAVKVDKRSADAHQYLGFALTGLQRLGDSVRSYEKAIALRPGFAEAHNNLGYALQALGRLHEAMAQYQKAIAIRSDYHEAHNNLGNALHLLDRSEDAIACYTKALEIKPAYAEAHWNLGTALRAVGRLEDAVLHYEKAIAIRPDYHEAYNSLGDTFRNLGRLEEAIAQFEKAVAVKPDYREAHINHGDALVALGQAERTMAANDLAVRHDEAAIAAYDKVLVLRPNDAQALRKRGEVLLQLHREAEALACFEAALTADPEYAFDALARCAIGVCDWTRTAAVLQEMRAHIAKGRFFHPFNCLAYSSDAALQLACAKRFVDHEVPVRLPQLWRGGTWRNQKIKIAYVSCGFHKHPTAYLTAELIEIHDRSRFEILGVSLGPDDQSEIRARLVGAFDQFYDVREKNNRDVALLLNSLQVDIAVDRSGYIMNARPGIFASRPAPIQVNYLGYPGTLGASFYDYIIADATVLPFDQQPFYSEKIVHLPDCYQVNDSKRPVAERIPTREEAGLPAQGFVFCSFNNCYKIAPGMFDIWMRLLRQINGSVLWLLCDKTTAEANLRCEAAARGVDPSRLIFARRLPLRDHLARHRLADLFLDTLPYNAHTTASDALWVGLPVVTCYGQSFPGRVAASLLRAIGMPDLITDDLEAYERLAMRIASEPAVLGELRERLRRNRLSHPLFDTDRYRRYIETAYVRMWEYWQRGEGPASFSVEPERDWSAQRL
jgi:predicted O-linked N-acetylglucosamine transferase (SPINDLY family)